MTLLLPLFFSAFLPSTSDAASSSTDVIYVVPIESHIERGLEKFLERAISEARETSADHIVIEMNTPGGAVDAASNIGQLFQSTEIPITVFVKGHALSAGAYIALNADQIVMVPRSTIGSATVIESSGNAADAKAMSFWIKAMEAAAESNGRDPKYARAMVDVDMEIEGLTEKGKPLTFKANQAIEYGYAEKIVDSREEVIDFLGLEKATIIEIETTMAEKVARFVTNPIIVPILFSLGSLGLMLELYSPGFGVPGIVGLTALSLFFFGHMIAGVAGWESMLLFVAGIILILIEIFVPGFGIFGVLGLVAVLSSLVLASTDMITGLKSLGWASIISVFGGFFIIRYSNKKGLWDKLILKEDLEKEESNERYHQKSTLLGKTGVTITKLRPAGTVKIEEVKYDVVSDGAFIERDKTVKVISVEGTRIVVSE
jgi:membrane-bound serine protease (ClpP class)